ncbi:GNAT family N-acetyltransferase [Rouxiella badensis]|jgi:RimJ/RimL family protein N-acetyltransferase|uniref:GNAT family N-acetyltransferase n=1 Tax=Rouxiella badensis TaxID=1646377 RepID=UPI001B4A4F1A|nr:GNAT family N-acetyltransferase [Rouxiella badensis]MCC3703432.1 GNAT family N-acetyltransferase [Rouxiella badensis]MCC3731855.1 GNAT family N-acetyltransferase [Rouxiella badensis]MCC3746640.1 GNAT family N-acetyltransferase [Rouxiella badensis]MCC3757244.1 GNAT family N-acetyltransferase [Rouxiella badensis]WAT09970.1 GNAT family N-acetyltransferase [Rouxiella badensis]
MKNKYGKTILLRPVETSDYEFVHSLRVAPKSTQFLTPVDDDPLQQKVWLENYKKREAAGEEYYFIIQRIDNQQPIGSLRAYGVDREKSIAHCGSWILNENKTMTSAIESILLMLESMNDIGIGVLVVDARKDNAPALRFIKKISHRYHGEDETNHFYEIDVPVMLATFYKENEHFILPDAPEKDA